LSSSIVNKLSTSCFGLFFYEEQRADGVQDVIFFEVVGHLCKLHDLLNGTLRGGRKERLLIWGLSHNVNIN